MFLAGSEPRGWFVVVEGEVRVVRGGAGRQHVVHVERSGGTLGEVPLFARGLYPATGIAAEPTICFVFAREALHDAIRSNPEVAFLLLERLALRVRTLVDRLDDRSVRSVQSRLAEFLASRHAAGSGGMVSIGMTQRDLAEELGTVREVVSRELRVLCERKLIAARGGGRYAVLDPEGLRRVSG
jgi:CRP/FNR family transcriptional regulator